LACFPRFGIFLQRKIWQPLFRPFFCFFLDSEESASKSLDGFPPKLFNGLIHFAKRSQQKKFLLPFNLTPISSVPILEINLHFCLILIYCLQRFILRVQ
jgi:hypothetical protein